MNDTEYAINMAGNMQNITEDSNSNITGTLTVSIYPAPTPETDITYNWQAYINNVGWRTLDNNARFTGATTNTLSGTGESSGLLGNRQIRCEITIDGVVYTTKEYSLIVNKETPLKESESSIGEAIQLITTKTFPVATEAFMKNDLWLLGMGFFVLTFLGVFLHWLLRRGRR